MRIPPEYECMYREGFIHSHFIRWSMERLVCKPAAWGEISSFFSFVDWGYIPRLSWYERKFTKMYTISLVRGWRSIGFLGKIDKAVFYFLYLTIVKNRDVLTLWKEWVNFYYRNKSKRERRSMYKILEQLDCFISYPHSQKMKNILLSAELDKNQK